MKTARTKKGLRLVIAFLIVTIFVIGAHLFFTPILSNRAFNNKKISYTALAFPKLQTSSFQSYPIAEKFGDNSYKLTLIPINPVGQPIKTELDIEGGSGHAMNINMSDPTSSPDLRIIAFIQNSNLWLISADGRNKVKLPENLKIDRISGWSPDSKKLLVYSNSEGAEKLFGRGEIKEVVSFSPDRLPEGFYLVDLEANVVRFLYPLNRGQFVSWINKEELIINYEDTFLVFNINTFSAESKTLKGFLNAYADIWQKDHISFSRDGKKWVVGMGNTGNSLNKPSLSKIVFADFPSPKGSIIAKGSWAQFQSPFISPEGKNVVYAKNEPSTWDLIVWSGANVGKIESARFQIWINDDIFIYAKYDGSSYSKYYLHDLTKSQDTPLN